MLTIPCLFCGRYCKEFNFIILRSEPPESKLARSSAVIAL